MGDSTVRATALAAALLSVAACAGAPMEAPSPASMPQEVDPAPSPIAVAVPEPTPEDSAADAAALQALQMLEFGSLAKGGDHVRSVVSPVVSNRLPEHDTDGRSSGQFARGGAASALGPTFDIDVESFASYDRVEYYMRFFLGPSQERFRIWLGRLNRYEGMIRQHFRTRGLPEDLVYLGLIESGYSNTAVSQANAVGMWQFIAATGRRYGLLVNEWVDDRRDPFLATDAAARHLSDLNDRFGSWYLAAAAYNGGPGRVSRGIRRLPGSRDSLQSDATFFELSDRRYLRRETRDYVPKLIAGALIAKEPLRYGFDSIPYLYPLVFDEVTVPDATGLDVLADLADTTTRALAELNPRYYRGVTPPRRTSIVRVPRGTGTMVAQRYVALSPDERVNFVEHKIIKGETLGLLAKQYGVSVSLLMAANPGIQPRRLRINQRVVIPVSSAARANPQRAPRPVRSLLYHTVRRGDSLWAIARRYGVSIGSLRRWNHIPSNSSLVKPGQRLRVAPG